MSKICHRKSASNTGLVGITETTRRGVPRFNVCWRPSKGVKKATTVYFTADTRAAALHRAIQIRSDAIASRARIEPMKP